MRSERRSLVAGMLFAGILAAAEASAWPGPSENLAVGDGIGCQAVPKVCAIPSGGFWVAWYDGGSGHDVRLERLGPDGEEVWVHGGILLADQDHSWVQDWGLDSDASGNAAVAFLDDRSGSDQVTVCMVTPDGDFPWGSGGITVSIASTEAFVGAPDVAATSDGGFVVAWTEDRSTRVQKLDREGRRAWATDVVLEVAGTENLHVADIEASEDGGAIVALVREQFQHHRYLCAQKLDAAGKTVWGEEPLVIFDAGSLQMGNYPEFTTDGAGGAVFAWYEAADYLQCYAQRILADGREAFPHQGVPVSTRPDQQRVDPSAAFVPETGEVLVFWVEEDMGQDQQGIQGQKIGADGSRLWTDSGAEIVPVGPRTHSFVRTVLDDAGAAVFFLQGEPGAGERVLGAAVGADGRVDAAAGILEVSTVASGKMRLAAACGGGSVALVWADERTDCGDIYAQGVERPSAEPRFVRGDGNADGKTDLSDPVALLNHLFLGGAAPSCEKASDADDGGELQITDAIRVLNWLFLGGPPPEPPFEGCGRDPSADALACASFPPCE